MKKFSITIICLLTTLVLNAQIPLWLPTDSLVAWYPFNNNADDESGNVNNGVLYGPVPTYDRFGTPNSAYYFDGIDDYVEISDSPYLDFSTGNEFTISFWMKAVTIYSLPNSAGVISKWGELGDEDDDWVIFVNNSLFQFNVNQSTTPGSPNSIVDYTLTDTSAWYNYIMTYKGSTAEQSLYIDGIAVDQISSAVPQVAHTTYSMMFGRCNSIPTNYYTNMILDDVAIWKRVLTTEEIDRVSALCYVEVTLDPINDTIDIYSENTAYFTAFGTDSSDNYQWQADTGSGFFDLTDTGQFSGTNDFALVVSNINITNDGILFRCIISSGSCSDTSGQASLTVYNTTISEDYYDIRNFTFYPNPVTEGTITVIVSAEDFGSQYYIYDGAGRIVKTGKLENNRQQIDIKLLETGAYYLGINGKSIKHKIIIIN